jgi:hypothetical protein
VPRAPGRSRPRRGSGSLCASLSVVGRRTLARSTPGYRLSPGTLAGALDTSGTSLRREPAPVAGSHGCSVRAGAAAGGPPGAPSQSGTPSRDGPVLRAHLGRRRRAGSPGCTVSCFILARRSASASHSTVQRSAGPGRLVSQSHRRRARAVQVGPATEPARCRHSALSHSAGVGTDGPQPSTSRRTRISTAGCGPDHQADRAWRLGERAGHRTPVTARPRFRSRTHCSTSNPISAPGPRVAPAFPAFRCKRRRRSNVASITPCCTVLIPPQFLSALLAAFLTNTPAPPCFALCTDPHPQGQVFVLH